MNKAGIGNFRVFGDFGGEDEEVHKKSQSEGTSLGHFTRFEPLTTKIGLSVRSVHETKKVTKKKKKKSQSVYISRMCGGATVRDRKMVLNLVVDLPEVINCANLGVDRTFSLGDTGGQNIGFSL